jgi:hypothetical protein
MGLLGAGPFRGGRAQVVQMADRDLWVLAHGRLQRVRIDLTFAEGPKAVAVWDAPLELGGPVHAAQVDVDPRTGRSTLFLVTAPADLPVVRATAVDDENGTILWQRQLGLLCQDEPLTLTGPQGALLLAQDQAGSLYGIDPEKYGSARWTGNRHLLAAPLEDNPQAPPMLLPGPDGRTAYQVASPGVGSQLKVRRVAWDAKAERWNVETQTTPLGSAGRVAPAGVPTLIEGALILQLSSGVLGRLKLGVAGAVLQEGSNWRSRVLGPEVRGYAAALGGDRFLTSNGGRGLMARRWLPANDSTTDLVPDGFPDPDDPTYTFPRGDYVMDRVAGIPLVLPGAAPGGPVEVCVADSSGAVHLLKVSSNGLIKPRRVWRLRAALTQGPFLASAPGEEVRISCVVGPSRLVLLDPAEDKPVWTYDSPSALIGLPCRFEDMLVTVDRSGQVAGLDPKTGTQLGPFYRLPGSVVPACGPVPFGPRPLFRPGRLLTPLSDGTMVLLRASQLR